MRWKTTKPLKPKKGTKRVKQKFLWLPVKIRDETRWLEYAAWVESYVDWDFYGYDYWQKEVWLEESSCPELHSECKND